MARPASSVFLYDRLCRIGTVYGGPGSGVPVSPALAAPVSAAPDINPQQASLGSAQTRQGRAAPGPVLLSIGFQRRAFGGV